MATHIDERVEAGEPAAISGVLRDATGDWTAAVLLDGALILGSFVLLSFVREKRGAPSATAAG